MSVLVDTTKPKTENRTANGDQNASVVKKLVITAQEDSFLVSRTSEAFSCIAAANTSSVMTVSVRKSLKRHVMPIKKKMFWTGCYAGRGKGGLRKVGHRMMDVQKIERTFEKRLGKHKTMNNFTESKASI